VFDSLVLDFAQEHLSDECSKAGCFEVKLCRVEEQACGRENLAVELSTGKALRCNGPCSASLFHS
jgi:hypothetical protein